MILAGDIGGTKTNLALATVDEGRLHLESIRSYPSQQYDSLEAIVDSYLADTGAAVDRACFGVAGPVVAGQAAITNLPWRIDEASLGARLRQASVRLINDVTALAHAVPTLDRTDLALIQEGAADPSGAIGIVAPGTGLGVGYLCWDGTHYRPGASEGGHIDFAPADELQAQLLVHLRSQYGHVSWERLASGPGLHTIYRFLRRDQGPEPAETTVQLAGGDPSAAISALGLSESDSVCSQALDIFVSVIGAYAGNLALTLMATGGVYLGGGIPPKILPRLQNELFIRAFRSKGRLSHVVERIPVYVVLSLHAQLIGAASCAATL